VGVRIDPTPRDAALCIALVAACLIACGATPRSLMPTPPSPLAAVSAVSAVSAAAVAGVTDPRLRDLISDHWEYSLGLVDGRVASAEKLDRELAAGRSCA
jgi:hypothetical protein